MTIDELLTQARSRLQRVTVHRLDAELAAGAVLVDIRPVDLRERDGIAPEAMIVERNVLEWRFAPSSKTRAVDLDEGQRVIVMCDEGYQSSLAAVALLDLGVTGATDLVGGFQAYLAAHR
jgi:rhodanese-related sulfurtransferase